MRRLSFNNNVEWSPYITIMCAIVGFFAIVLTTSNIIGVPSVEAKYVFSNKWGAPGSDAGQFNHPDLLAVDASNRVYVVDTANDRIQKFLPANICPASTTQIVPGICFVRKWGARGEGNGQFVDPGGIAVDTSGRVYVVDTNRNRIQMFHGVGTFIRTWGTLGDGKGQFHSPYGIAVVPVDSPRYVYVSDFGDDRIQKFQIANPCPAGTIQIKTNVCFVTEWGKGGTGNGQFEHPSDVAIDSSGNLYVADTFNFRIQKFQMANPCTAGTTQIVVGVCFVTMWGSLGTGSGEFKFPSGVAVDRFGYLYVADSINNRIQKFQMANPCPAGTTQIVVGVCFVTMWGSLGTDDGQFDLPTDVAVDSLGNVFVTDYKNNRVQTFVWKPDVEGSLENRTVVR